MRRVWIAECEDGMFDVDNGEAIYLDGYTECYAVPVAEYESLSLQARSWRAEAEALEAERDRYKSALVEVRSMAECHEDGGIATVASEALDKGTDGKDT